MWDEQLHVPLMIRVPGEAPRGSNRLLSSIDVLPTAVGFIPELRDTAFLEQGPGMDVLAGDYVEAPVFGMTPRQHRSFSLMTGRWKLLRREGSVEFLFDLTQDPHELVDLSAAEPEVTKRLSGMLDESLSVQKAGFGRNSFDR
ncbi:MAG: arylsulfatase A-like enzyme [Planctomycetota bacterium]